MTEPRLLDLGDTALTLEFGDTVDLALSRRVMTARDALGSVNGVVDVVPTYRSLTVHFDPQVLTREDLSCRLLQAANSPAQSASVEAALATSWRIPVLFGGENGPDLAEVAQTTGRSEADIVDAFCQIELRVFMVGFLPGFPYLGELPQWLQLPRRSTPRSTVPARSVAIAGAQAAIYPWQSPGGWHLIGSTPLRTFDLRTPDHPALLAAGDSVKFTPVNAAEFDRLSAAIKSGELSPKTFLVP